MKINPLLGFTFHNKQNTISILKESFQKLVGLAGMWDRSLPYSCGNICKSFSSASSGFLTTITPSLVIILSGEMPVIFYFLLSLDTP